MSAGICVACNTRLRSRRQWICPECVKAGDRAFARLYPFVDERSHQRNVSAFYGDLDARIAAIRAERGLVEAVA